MAGSTEAQAVARSEGTRMIAMHTLWPIWVIALVFALAGRNESAHHGRVALVAPRHGCGGSRGLLWRAPGASEMRDHLSSKRTQ
jgi:hypothetical protein